MDHDVSSRVASWIDDRAGLVLAGFVIVTIALAAAFVGLEDDSTASQEPDDAVFDVRDELDERLPPLFHPLAVVAEANDGDILLAAPLQELWTNTAALRAADGRGELAPEGVEPQPLLARQFDVDAGVAAVGVLTLADAVDTALQAEFGVDLADATDDMVKVAVSRVLADPATAGLAEQLSVEATTEEAAVLGRDIVLVRSPALLFLVNADNEPLGGGSRRITPDDDPISRQKEGFNLNVQRLLRGDEAEIQVWGIAADINETADEQGETAALFIVLAVVAVVVIVGVSLRSYWAMALTGTGLAVLMLWLGGISNLVGLKGGLVIDLIVPIAMIALGVDFAVHSLARYREARRGGSVEAFRVGLGAVFTALVLATLTDSVAFLSNTTSGIESIVHFAVAAAIATSSSFVVLGVIAPLTLSRIESGLGPNTGPRRPRERAAVLAASVSAAALAGGVVILIVAVSAVAGALLTILLAVATLAIPYRIVRRRMASTTQPPVEPTPPTGRVAAAVGELVGRAARHPRVVLATTGLVTGLAIVGALGLQGSFDVEDFFASDTDFVVSLDKLEKHGGDRAGESARILIEGELDDPETVAAIGVFIDDLGTNPRLARTAAGELSLGNPGPLEVLTRLTTTPYAAAAVAAKTGIQLVDGDDDGIPDTAEQLAAAWSYATTQGVPLDADTIVYTAAEVGTTIDLDPNGPDLAVVTVQIPDPSQLDKTRQAQELLQVDIESLQANPAIIRVGASGSALGRLVTIDAGTDALKRSLPVAVVAVVVLLSIALRSVRYAVATTVPMLLVAAWLYGTMALFGFSLNFVTATIGAISIGVGADYAIHMTDRYRHERRRHNDHIIAAAAAGRSTGVALLGSAVSTAVGFAIMGFAPMPLFATFGILTALMVTFALIASLLVLPPLLGLAAGHERAP